MQLLRLFAAMFILASPGMAAALQPVQVGEAPVHLQRGYEYMLKPGQAMIVSVIKVRESWHVILIEGEEDCPAFAHILDPATRPVSVCDDMTFFLDQGAAGGLAVFVKSSPP